MKRFIGMAIVAAALALPAGAQAHVPTCAHPWVHRGVVLPLELTTAVVDNEWYVLANNAPVGCYYILLETVRAPVEGATVWHFDAFRNGSGINPNVAPGEVICYELKQTDDAELPMGIWRESNEVCVEGFEGERT